MRIGMISTLSRPVPPKAEGSVELLVSHLTESLVRRGHDVTLFALPESQTSARLMSPVEKSYVDDSDKWDWQLYEAFQVREAFARWRDFDVINCHSYWFGLMHADAVPIPSIHSLHIEPGPDYRFLAQHTRNGHLHFCSNYQAHNFADIANSHIIPHGIDVDVFPTATAPADSTTYLAWLGRFHPGKGVLEAIELAHAAGIPLKLAAPANDYFREAIAPHVDEKLIEYVGELAVPEKIDFLKSARALLYPVQRGEPFGLVLIEAMAAGLPVIAYDRGAVSEIIEPGITGFTGNTPAELLAAIHKCPQLDRTKIQNHARTRYSLDLMATRMEKLMRQVSGQ